MFTYVEMNLFLRNMQGFLQSLQAPLSHLWDKLPTAALDSCMEAYGDAQSLYGSGEV